MRANERTGMTATARKLKVGSIVQVGDYDYRVTAVVPVPESTRLWFVLARCGSDPVDTIMREVDRVATVDVVRF